MLEPRSVEALSGEEPLKRLASTMDRTMHDKLERLIEPSEGLQRPPQEGFAKPPASRKGSVEWFVVAQGFKGRAAGE